MPNLEIEMKRILIAIAMLAPLPAMADGQPAPLMLSPNLVQEIFYVLGSSGTANATLTRLQNEVQHQPAKPADPIPPEPH